MNGKESGLNPTVLKRVLCSVTLIAWRAQSVCVYFSTSKQRTLEKWRYSSTSSWRCEDTAQPVLGEVKIQLNVFLEKWRYSSTCFWRSEDTAQRVLREVKIEIKVFLTSKLHDWSVLILGIEQPVHWIAGWVGTRVVLAAVERNSPRFLSIQKLIPTELSGSPYCLVIKPADRCKNKVSSNVCWPCIP
jgi:hypothetical protein